MATLTTEVEMSTSPVSLRLSNRTTEKVRQIAAIEHRSVADTVRVLTEEAIKMREFPEILFTTGPTGRRATFRQGPDVWEVVEPYVVAGRDWDALRASYPELLEPVLRTAIRYYGSYPEEIDARIEANSEGL
jgi:uncharacterized protein (DUF433 family)